MTAATPPLSDVTERVLALTLNHPQRLNAPSPEMISQVIAALER